MKCFLIFCTFQFCFLSFNSFGSELSEGEPVDTLTSSWRSVVLTEIASFSFPEARMEIQNASIKRLADSVKTQLVIPVAPSKLTLQQKGLNTGESYRYTRVIVEQLIGDQGDFLPSDIKLESITKEEKIMLKDFYQENVAEGILTNGAEVIKWFPIELLEINNSFCVHIKYVRASVVGKGDVVASVYCFPDDSREVFLTTACRLDDYENWSGDFDVILNSFRLDQGN